MKLDIIPTWTAEYRDGGDWMPLPGVFRGDRTPTIIEDILTQEPQAMRVIFGCHRSGSIIMLGSSAGRQIILTRII